MIHKIHTPRPTFKSIIKYVCEKKDENAEILGGNVPTMCGKNPTQNGATGDLIKKFQYIENLNHNHPAPVFHSSISLNKGEHLTNEQWLEVAEKYLQKIGIDTKTQPFFVTKHTDTDHEHIHIVASQVNFHGKNCWLKNGSFWRGKEACRELEREYKLTAPQKKEKAAKEKSNAYEKKQAARKNQKYTAKEKIQNTIDEIIKNNKFDLKTESGREFFKTKLNENEILVKYTLQQGGEKLTGMAFSYDGQAYSGTKLGTDYKTNALIKRGLHIDAPQQQAQAQTQKSAPPVKQAARQSSGISETKIFLQTMAQEMQKERPNLLRAILNYLKRVKALEKAKAEAMLKESQKLNDSLGIHYANINLNRLDFWIRKAEQNAKEKKLKTKKEINAFLAENYSAIQYTPKQRAAGAAQGSAELPKTESQPAPTTTPAPEIRAAGVEKVDAAPATPEPPAKPSLDEMKKAYIDATECGKINYQDPKNKLLLEIDAELKAASDAAIKAGGNPRTEREKFKNEKESIRNAAKTAYENMINKKAQDGKPLVMAYLKPKENERGDLEMQDVTLIWQVMPDATGNAQQDQKNQENRLLDFVKNIDTARKNNPDSPIVCVFDETTENLTNSKGGIKTYIEWELDRNAILKTNFAEFSKNPTDFLEKARKKIEVKIAVQKASAKVNTKLAAEKAAEQKTEIKPQNAALDAKRPARRR